MIKGFSKIVCKDTVSNQFLTFKGYSILNKQNKVIKIFINVNNESMEFLNNDYINVNDKSLKVIKVIKVITGQ